MQKIKRFFLILQSVVLIIGGSGCEISNRESMSENETASESEDSNVIIKDDSEVKEIVNEYLKEKYEKEFKISMTDRPSRIYNSYLLTAYDENFESISVTISFTDENNYTISDDGLMLKIAGDLEIWYAELVDPYIESEFKVFFRGIGFTLPDDYKDCETAEDFLKLSPTSEYCGLLFTVLLPASEYNKSWKKTASDIANAMAEEGIRGMLNIVVYKDENVYDNANTHEEEHWYWMNAYKARYASCGVQANFNVYDSSESEYGLNKEEN